MQSSNTYEAPARQEVSKSGFYAWEGRGQSARRRSDEQLGAAIARIHRESRGAYGSPRVHKALRREGIHCSNKRVARLMRELGLRGRVSNLYRRSPSLHKFFAKTGNLRLEEPLPTRLDQIWVATLPTFGWASTGVTWPR
jgi:transposase InsO family protein